ncbi:hypothetical protein ZIOFF_013359 [Zingiber officinale]|uniref:Uncharacterized protein n=1 Tax=Zingiber officinale TaxID=94328 RepID=A0A8J5LQ51_ZINOF|nr:hypothetical protein ZIOFF_013359 [Zingiber officinale]
MGMVFRSRDYGSEEIACSLARRVTDDHPLALRSSTSSQVIPDSDVSFDDPLRANTADPSESMNWQNNCSTFKNRCSSEADNLLKKEWILLKGSLTQKFTSSNTIAVSQISDMIARNNRGDKSLADIHLEEQDYLETSLEEEKIEISRKEYFLRLQELKGEINLAWRSEDRIRALKFSIKVARLLMDTSVLQFYPTLFTLVVDVMDMFGTLVWERIKKRAEYANDGTLLRCLPADVISDKAVEIIDFVEQNKDISVESHLVYRRVGHKLCESRLSLNSSCAVMNRIMQVLVQYNNLYEYLMIADAHLDIILLYSLFFSVI